MLRDNDGAWIHASLSYVCRDRAGNPRPTSADPEPVRPAGSYGRWPWSAAGRNPA
ncbi:hypothetical protein GCM10027605_48090 [Micromonospora zhanjiangensis]